MTTLLQDQVLAMPTRTPQTRARISPKDAYTEIINRSQLRILAENEHLNAEDGSWVSAVTHDMAILRGFLDAILGDLHVMTGVQFVYDEKIALASVREPFATNKERVRQLAVEYVAQVVHHYSRLISLLQTVKTNRAGTPISMRYVPISPVVFSDPKDVATFSHVSMDRRNLYEIKFVNANLKPFDDFTRSIPNYILHHVERIKSTVFDWTPKILDGVLVEETHIARSRYIWDFAYQHGVQMLERIQNINLDPALVISPDGEKLLAINFWKEGKEALTPYQQWAGKHFKTFDMIRNVSITVACFTALIALAISFPDPKDTTPGIVIGMVASILGTAAGVFMTVVDYKFDSTKYKL